MNSLEKLWTDEEVQTLVNSLNELSKDYILKAYDTGFDKGFSEGRLTYSKNPPWRVKTKYVIIGMSVGAGIGVMSYVITGR